MTFNERISLATHCQAAHTSQVKRDCGTAIMGGFQGMDLIAMGLAVGVLAGMIARDWKEADAINAGFDEGRRLGSESWIERAMKDPKP